MAYNIVKFFHVLAVVFMAAPLYNLIVVHERRRLGKAPFLIDRYFENIPFCSFFMKQSAETKCLTTQCASKYISIYL